jgi:pyruvate formate lyase activating enzyme
MEACPTQCITPGDDKRIRIDRDKCIKCYKCVEVCPSKALVTKGSIYTIEELIEEVTRDEQFFQASDGGVTLSGGEVLLQHEFATLILKQLKKRGINTAIETTGFGSWKYLEELSEYVDTILYDIKHYDSIIHEKFTGVPNEIIIENLRRLLDHKSNVVVRTTLIPGFNMDDNSVNGIISLLKELNVKRVDLLKFHQLGSSKYESLGVDYKLKGIRALEDNDIISIKEKFIKNGFNISIGG